ncbi:MAG TPA: alpha/beta fold hydrolase [Gemmatimonadaceae bacterium]|jgi:pimeloyl-ACP methyl ester carboxylesterase|nr:alpha/beta fold hydrolase [Gemmatimonadaceae bacterium]
MMMMRRITWTLSMFFSVAATLNAQRPATSSIVVDGHTLVVLTAGESKPGVPAIVFSSGFGAGAVTWGDVQSDVATLTKTIAYDRSGVGESQPSTRPRTIQNLADEMHAVLAATHVSPPYVLVGHSYGGPIIHTFAARYPKEVAGLVYVDPTDFMQTRDDICAVARAAQTTDCNMLARLNAQVLQGAPPGLVAEAREIERAEADGFTVFRVDGDAPIVPTVVLLAGKNQPLPPGVTFPGDGDRWFAAFLQQRIAHFSSVAGRLPDGALVLTSASDHFIYLTEPELVTWGIRRVLAAASVHPELARLVGDYAFAPTVSMTITQSGGKLFVQLTGQPKFALTQESPTAFALALVGARLEFELDPAGKGASVTLVQNGIRQIAKRK